MAIEEREVIENFYRAFQRRDVETMLACYHPKLVFEDPVFGSLGFEGTKKMWTYLLDKGDKNMKIRFEVINDHNAHWEAIYTFAKTGNKVHNKIDASFEFENGKIIKHTDAFDLWKWSGMALGLPGYLFGWSPMMKNKIKKSVAFIVA